MTGDLVEFSFDPGVLTCDEVARLSVEIWSDLAFDHEARAHLKRDGLNLDGARLTGPSPYHLEALDDGQIRVRVEAGPSAEVLLDLWRVHVTRGPRLGSIAA